MQQNNLWQNKATLIRKYCLVSTTEAGSGHPTSCLSAADITTVLFDKYFSYDINEPLNLYNDRFVLSKGHAAPLLYSLFGMARAYPLEEVKKLRKLGSRFEGHPTPKFIYAEAATGSLGQGLSAGAGLALVCKREKIPNTTYVLLGDGELAEGQVWEAANFASFHQLDNLIALLDINRLAQSGETMFGYHVNEYANRFAAFGFEVISIDGHDFTEIDAAFQKATGNTTGKPVVIIAKTVKGKGISFLENKEGWHGKPLKKEELEDALQEWGDVDDALSFELKKPSVTKLPAKEYSFPELDMEFDAEKEYATREVFGEVLAKLGEENGDVYALDGDVKNSTFTEDFSKAFPERFVECFIAEQNMVSVAAGLSRLGKIPFVATFAAFLTRAADQVRMARISRANIKFVGSHAGVSIGEDGPSQMGLEDISMFGTLPDTVILQPADATATLKLLPLITAHMGFCYLRTLRSKTKLLYKANETFSIGGSKILRSSAYDLLTVAATGITVFEALKAAEKLALQDVYIRVVDIYSINPIDRETLLQCLLETSLPVLITVEDHFIHGGMGDFAASAVADSGQVEKMAVTEISQSGKMEELLNNAGIDAAHIVDRVKSFIIKPTSVLSN